MVFPPKQAPSPSERQAAWEQIKKILERASENSRDVPEADMEAALDEAMVHVRSR